MDQPIIRQIIRLVAIRISTLRGPTLLTASESLLDYFRLLHKDVSKQNVETIISECHRRMKENGMTGDQLWNEAMTEIRESLEHKDQLHLYLMLLDLANQSESLDKIILPLNLAADFGIS